MTPDKQKIEDAIGFLMNAFNAPEFEERSDEVNRSWESIAYHMVEFANKEIEAKMQHIQAVYIAGLPTGDCKAWDFVKHAQEFNKFLKSLNDV